MSQEIVDQASPARAGTGSGSTAPDLFDRIDRVCASGGSVSVSGIEQFDDTVLRYANVKISSAKDDERRTRSEGDTAVEALRSALEKAGVCPDPPADPAAGRGVLRFGFAQPARTVAEDCVFGGDANRRRRPVEFLCSLGARPLTAGVEAAWRSLCRLTRVRRRETPGLLDRQPGRVRIQRSERLQRTRFAWRSSRSVLAFQLHLDFAPLGRQGETHAAEYVAGVSKPLNRAQHGTSGAGRMRCRAERTVG
jgi:hypothetical protein